MAARDDAGPPPDWESTQNLLERARRGDQAAINQLFGRYMPMLRRWASRRIPPGARHLGDTDDIVQITMVRALNHLNDFEYRHVGSFLAWLRQIAFHQIINQVRAAQRRPAGTDLSELIPDGAPAPLEAVLGRELLDAYERALQRLPERYRQVLIVRIELEMSFAEIAEAMGSPNAEAARQLVVRALQRLREEMHGRGR